MHTCNSASDPGAWLPISPKLENTRIFHLIYFTCMCVCVFVFSFHSVEEFPLSVYLGEQKGQIVKDSVYPSVSVTELHISLSIKSVFKHSKTHRLSHTPQHPELPRGQYLSGSEKAGKQLEKVRRTNSSFLKDRFSQWHMIRTGLCLLIELSQILYT